MIRSSLKTKLRALLLPDATQNHVPWRQRADTWLSNEPPLLLPGGLDPDRSWCSVLTCMLSVASRYKKKPTSEQLRWAVLGAQSHSHKRCPLGTELLHLGYSTSLSPPKPSLQNLKSNFLKPHNLQQLVCD